MTLDTFWHLSTLAKVLYPEGIPNSIPELDWPVNVRGNKSGTPIYQTEMDECQAKFFLDLARNPKSQDMLEICRSSNCSGFLSDAEWKDWLPIFMIAAEYAEQVIQSTPNYLPDHVLEQPHSYIFGVLPRLIRNNSISIPYEALRIAYDMLGLDEMSEFEEQDLLGMYKEICKNREDPDSTFDQA